MACGKSPHTFDCCHCRCTGSTRSPTSHSHRTLSNKLKGKGWAQYERKRSRVLASDTHLIEIDLLCAGKPLPMRIHQRDRHSDYRITVSCSHHHPRADASLTFPFLCKQVKQSLNCPSTRSYMIWLSVPGTILLSTIISHQNLRSMVRLPHGHNNI